MQDGKKTDLETLKAKVNIDTLGTRFRPIYDDMFADLLAKLDETKK